MDIIQSNRYIIGVSEGIEKDWKKNKYLKNGGLYFFFQFCFKESIPGGCWRKSLQDKYKENDI